MKKHLLFIWVSYSLLFNISWAMPPSQLDFHASSSEVELKSTSTATWLGFIDVYDAALYAAPDIQASQILRGNHPFSLELRYKVSLSKSQLINSAEEVLSRQHLSGWADRDGLIFNTPAGAVHGPKLMLIDQDAGSGGDYLPHTFRYAGIGKLMGTRTWGGLIGISANPRLMDGGGLVVPFFRFFDPEGNWSVENEGVAPDIEVVLDPIATNRGEDSQLSAAIREITAQLEAHENKVLRKAPPLPTELGQ